MNLQQARLDQIRGFLAAQELDALVLSLVSSFAWATVGHRSYVNTASSTGIGTLVITAESQYLVTNTIEAPRLEQEEGLAAAGWELRVAPWYERDDTVGQLVAGKRTGSDTPLAGARELSGELAWQRLMLLPEEIERVRLLGRSCAEAMHAAIRSVAPGMTEYEIGAQLAYEAERRGAQVIVNLIATDERIFRFRHPLPTAKRLENYAMLVLCGRQNGLVCSITRLVHFGRLSDSLRVKADAVAQVDGAFILATQPGRTLDAIFADGQAAYAATGFADEWKYHHQGGPAGYEPRELIAVPGMAQVVAANQVYAWNPSIAGTKSEDTVLVGAGGHEVLTAIEGWPTQEIRVGGRSIARPAILEL